LNAACLAKTTNEILDFASVLFSAQKLQDRLEVLIDYMACTIEPVRNGKRYRRRKSNSKTFNDNYTRGD